MPVWSTPIGWKNIISPTEWFHWSKCNCFLNFRSSSWCYKTFFGRNLDFSKIKKLKKLCSECWTCTKMGKQYYYKVKLYSEIVFCFKMAYSCCFSWRGNLDSSKKSFITSTTCWICRYKKIAVNFLAKADNM